MKRPAAHDAGLHCAMLSAPQCAMLGMPLHTALSVHLPTPTWLKFSSRFFSSNLKNLSSSYVRRMVSS